MPVPPTTSWRAAIREEREGLGATRKESYAGQAKQAHREAEAERLMKLGLATLGVTAARLAETAKGTLQTQALVWWL